MFKVRFPARLYPVLYMAGSLIIAGSIFSMQGFTSKIDSDALPERLPSLNKSLLMPQEMAFAGESVPVDNYDTHESLDRELLVNGYWQSHTLMILKRSHRYFRVIEPVLKKYGVPDDFKYMAMAESGLENAVSPAGAAGVWQLLESTAREYGLEVNADIDERYNLEKATEAACKFLVDAYTHYGNWTLAAAAYNAGRKGIDLQMARQNTQNYYDLLLNEETGRYIFRVIAHKLITENPDQYGFHLDEKDYYPVITTHKVKVDSTINNLALFAQSQHTNYKILKQLNPWLRQNYLTDRTGKDYYVEIPDEGERSLK
jgi:membrane-bound lytic murein transglycosylase D